MFLEIRDCSDSILPKTKGTYAHLPGVRKVLNRKFKFLGFGDLVTKKKSFDNKNCSS